MSAIHVKLTGGIELRPSIIQRSTCSRVPDRAQSVLGKSPGILAAAGAISCAVLLEWLWELR